MRKILFILFLGVLPFFSFGQLTGVVTDSNSGEAIIGAKVFASDGNKAITNFDGEFTLKTTSFPVTLVTKMLQYNTDSTVVDSPGKVKIKLGEPVTDLQMVVVSAGRRKQAIEEVPVSIEIIKPELIDNKVLRV